MASESLKSEPVIDSRVAQLEAALAEISDLLAYRTEQHDRLLAAFDARGVQVATLQQENLNLQQALRAAEAPDAAVAILTRELDEARADYDKLLTSWAEACEKRVEAQRQTDTLTRQLAEAKPYLKDDETVAECIARNRADGDTLLTLLAQTKQRAESAERQLAVKTGECGVWSSEVEMLKRQLTDESAQSDAFKQMFERTAEQLDAAERQIAAIVAEKHWMQFFTKQTHLPKELRAMLDRLIALLLPASPPETARAGEASEAQCIIDRKDEHIERLQRQIEKLETRIDSLLTVDDGNPWKPEPVASPTPTKEPQESKCSNCHGTGRVYYGVLCLRCSGTGIDPSITSSQVTSDHVSQPGEMVAPPPTAQERRETYLTHLHESTHVLTERNAAAEVWPGRSRTWTAHDFDFSQPTVDTFPMQMFCKRCRQLAEVGTECAPVSPATKEPL